MKKKLLSILALLCMTVSGAWAQGALTGVFSVGEGSVVCFSKGNLRYASGTWSFFDNQYDYYTSYNANAWDKFGWSTSKTTYGMSTSTTSGDYSGAFVDWGATMGTGWRTLTSAEWTYLFNTRSASTVGGTANGRYAKATVNGKTGMILFPDTYTHPDGVTAPTSVNTGNAAFTANSYSSTDWEKMESAGCVFLPAAGLRSGASVSALGTNGYYWSSTTNNDSPSRMGFRAEDVTPDYNSYRYNGFSVRLVINAYSVTYNANGGSGAPSVQGKSSGINLTLSSTVPTRDGYTFTGWNTRMTAVARHMPLEPLTRLMPT